MKMENKILEYAAGCSLGELNGGELIEDLGIDSLSLIDALVEHDISFDDKEFVSVKTVDDLRRLLNK